MKARLLSSAILILFSAYTLLVMLQAEQSLWQFGQQLMSSPDTAQVVIDLYLLAALAFVWMYHDNKARQRSALSLLPYFLITAVYASIGPLLYLALRGPGKQVENAE